MELVLRLSQGFCQLANFKSRTIESIKAEAQKLLTKIEADLTSSDEKTLMDGFQSF